MVAPENIENIATNLSEEELKKAHGYSSNNKEALSNSESCGCFYCLVIFLPKEIKEWTDNSQTAICPYCSIDSVIGSASGIEVSKFFLSEMNRRWF